MTAHLMPRAEDVKNTFVTLFGDGVEVADHDGEADSTHLAVFIDDDDAPVTAIAVDLPFTAYLGAALTMIPKGGADDAIAEGEVSEMMVANVQEIMNICSRWFMDNSTPHLRLDSVYPVKTVPESAMDLYDGGDQVSFTVHIPEYGAGTITCSI